MADVHEFNVEMTCEGCSKAVERVLKKLEDKVEDISIDLEKKTVCVKSSLPYDELLKQLQKTGKTVSYVGIRN